MKRNQRFKLETLRYELLVIVIMAYYKTSVSKRVINTVLSSVFQLKAPRAFVNIN